MIAKAYRLPDHADRLAAKLRITRRRVQTLIPDAISNSDKVWYGLMMRMPPRWGAHLSLDERTAICREIIAASDRSGRGGDNAN